MPRVVHFEISADDPARSLKFYQDVFGWQSQKWDGPSPYWLVRTGQQDEPGIDGGLMQRPHPQSQITLTIGVDSVDGYIAKVRASGGRITAEKMAVPGAGYLAYCLDTEDNPFGLFQPDPNAA